MKRAPWYVLAGAVAGFAGVLAAHGRPAAQAAGQPAAGGQGQGAPGGAGSSPGAGSGTGASRTATGALEQYGYGELSVRVSVRGSQISAVTVPTIRTAEQYSQQLSDQVIPMLRSQVMAVDSARIHGISGATYTSEAYAASLQSALDKLHIR